MRPPGSTLSETAPFNELVYAIAFELCQEAYWRGPGSPWSPLELAALRYTRERERRDWNLSAFDREYLRGIGIFDADASPSPAAVEPLGAGMRG